MAVDEAGHPCGSRYQEFPQYFPRPGWVEHDADEIWAAVAATLGELLAELSAQSTKVAAIGITNQRETTVVWDRRTGRPLHRAIVWQDRRTAAICHQLEEDGHLPLIRARTGLVLDPYFSGTKLRWLFAEGGVEPGPNVAFGTVDSWILWNLTAGARHATDASNAARTLLFDIRRLQWDPELAELMSVPETTLPEVQPSSGLLGTSASEVVPGLPSGVPITGCAGDQQAALFGQACLAPGMTKNTYGTGSFVLMNVGPTCPEPVDGLLTTVAWTMGDAVTYALEGAIFVTGAAIQWLRDGLGLISESSDIGPLAESVPDTGGAYFVPALTGLGSPWWDPQARGSFVGITRGVGRAQLARAVVESMAYQTRDVVDTMTVASGHALRELRVDGGASVMPLLLRLQADLLGVPVVKAAVSETTALGAAFLAGLGQGVWSSLGEISDIWASDATVQPSGDPAARSVVASGHQGWLRAVERSRGWADSDPAEWPKKEHA